MPFDWSSLVDLAESLHRQAATGTNPEAYYRSVANRAYFGAFGHANNYASQFLNYQPRDDADEHGRLRAHLRTKRRRAASDGLGKLREWRNHADYLDDLPWQEWQDMSATAENAIRQARLVLAALPPPQPRKS